eukprot:CAMPEP_0171065898 /NCGR_PEP_ID=MMETSP0766_2-20121228/7112_1 /TAXON_ID=439317 /ORGANISM="Gambierdiscus australes, Strain CAWD 149" /LENGTH=136 /DNA_ID=CAMNT_0011522037 /DNA_START=134 /DNA_END=544 /DNA_ORIENTATION=+
MMKHPGKLTPVWITKANHMDWALGERTKVTPTVPNTKAMAPAIQTRLFTKAASAEAAAQEMLASTTARLLPLMPMQTQRTMMQGMPKRTHDFSLFGTSPFSRLTKAASSLIGESSRLAYMVTEALSATVNNAKAMV